MKNLSLKKAAKTQNKHKCKIQHIPFTLFKGQIKFDSRRFMRNFGSFTTAVEVKIRKKFIELTLTKNFAMTTFLAIRPNTINAGRCFSGFWE